MGFINYDVSIQPSTPEVNFDISLTPSNLTVKLDSLGDYSLKVDPSEGTIVGGVIAGSILGAFGGGPIGALLGGGVGVGTVYAVGALIKSGLESGIKDGIKGKEQTIDFGQPLGISIKVEGADVNVALTAVNLSTYNGMLMAAGQVHVK